MPHALVGQEIDARITHHAVELLHRGQRIACHARSERHGEFTTVTAHIVLACALEEQLRQPEAAAMSFEERLTLLVDREIHYGNDRKRTGAAAGRIMLPGSLSWLTFAVNSCRLLARPSCANWVRA